MESQPFVGISKGLQPENRLWRYMSLDKLIDLLSTRSLYMSPVTQFEATDPYEGQDQSPDGKNLGRYHAPFI